MKDLKTLIEMIAKASDSQLDTMLTKECTEFLQRRQGWTWEENDPQALKFLRDLRDKAVFGGGASGFMMGVFSIAVDHPPESEAERHARQDELERTWLGESS